MEGWICSKRNGWAPGREVDSILGARGCKLSIFHVKSWEKNQTRWFYKHRAFLTPTWKLSSNDIFSRDTNMFLFSWSWKCIWKKSGDDGNENSFFQKKLLFYADATASARLSYCLHNAHLSKLDAAGKLMILSLLSFEDENDSCT